MTDVLVGTVLADRYRLDELLGEGGMGKVYAAEHVLMRKRLAIKILHRELCAMPEVIARFEREAMATANIEHPNIAAATDCGKLEDGSLFLVLELVQGKNLRDEVARGPFEIPRALGIARQIASALASAHALGIVHRDLKPENVMLVSRGDEADIVKVLDFGIAKLPVGQPSALGPQAAPLTKTGVVFGTPEYMSPEQALGQAVDPRADLYALGVITYEMLCGLRPFHADSDAGLLGQQLAQPVPPFAERAPGVVIPRQIEAVVHKLLAKDVASRYQTADELVQALDELLLPSPGTDARLYTQPDGSPTAFLGTAQQVYSAPPLAPPEPVATQPVAVAPAPAPPVIGPSGTLAMLDEGKKQELAERVAEVRAVPPSAPSPVSLALAQAREAFTVVCDFVDENRVRLPENVRRALRDVPAAALVGVAFLLVWGPVLIAFAFVVTADAKVEPTGLVAQGGPVASASAAAPDPVHAEIAAARTQGHAALEKLAERYPKHGHVLLALAQSYASQHPPDLPTALALLGKALALDEKLHSDPTASEIASEGAHDSKSADAAFALLGGPMAASGAVVLYDLSVDQKAPASLRTRAQKAVVQDPGFMKNAPPHIEVAAKLRYAKKCSDKHGLLSRAAEVGDERALAYMKILAIRGGCGRRAKDDCFPCMRKDSALKDAIAALEKRLAGK